MHGSSANALDYRKDEESQVGFTVVNLRDFSGPTAGVRPLVTESRPAPPAETGAWVEDYLGRDAARFFYKWGGSLSSVLVRLRGRYEGDLDQFLLHLVFMLTELAQANFAAEAKAKGAQTVIVRRRGLNVLSLSEITRVPRETVRRKLAVMAERGLVTREEDGLFYPGPASDIDAFFYALSPLFWDGVKP
jgi:hypothetical protein